MKFSERIEEILVTAPKPKIAFGLKESQPEIENSLKQGLAYADITLVGPKAIESVEDFAKIIDDNPERKLAELFAADEFEGIIRGTIDDFKTINAYEEITGEKCTLNPGLLQDPSGREFFISPASNPEAWDKESRYAIAKGIAEFVKPWGIDPKIAVFTGVRHCTYQDRKNIHEGVKGIVNKTYEDAEWIVAQLKKDGYKAVNHEIELNTAVEEGYNVIIPVNGMVGNQIFRVFLFCGGKVIAVPRVTLSRCYEDNSRTEKDYLPHIKWLVAWIASKKKNP